MEVEFFVGFADRSLGCEESNGAHSSTGSNPLGMVRAEEGGWGWSFD